LPPEMAGTFIEDLVRDQTSAQHPGAPAVVAALAEAVGILHTDPALVVLPDDPRLGQFRDRFAGTLGFFERRATIEPGRAGLAGAREIIRTDTLFARTQRGPDDQVDLGALVTARLFDMWIGDWDRHRDQFTWARLGDGAPRRWAPIPEDRDNAFARYDGLMLGVARLQAPFLLDFGPEYGSVFGHTWNGRDMDRRFLTVLDSAAWDSVARAMAARLTDSVIERAVRRLPPELYRLDGDRLARALKARRDGLAGFAHRYRRHLARWADVHGTDAAERIAVNRAPDGTVDVSIAAGVAPPYVRARFRPRETDEIRLYLHGGDDVVVVRGPRSAIRLRVVGGGAATVVDSSGAGGVTLYAAGEERPVGRVRVDRRRPVEPPLEEPYKYWRDWGSTPLPVWWLSYGPDLGLTLGGGLSRTSYGFRKFPYASRMSLRAGFAFDAARPRADLEIEWRHENTRRRTTLDARASGIEVVRFHGLGNETTLGQPDAFYRVRQEQFRLAPAVHFPLGPRVELTLGVLGERIRTRTDSGRIIAATLPYGTGTFLQAGALAGIDVDTRDLASNPTRGVTLRLGGRLLPPIGDVDSVYGSVEGQATTYLTAPIPLRPTLALRVGGKYVWGAYPFFEAAFIGDARTARLGHQHRFGGDGAVYGNAELRLRLTRFFVILPGELGVLALADGGRVFLAGESSDTWHTAFGGGLWISVLGPGNVLSAALASSDERTALYLGLGMAY
ncbi:MAG TPA: BamA/TamA family outer membrane protein, partial [Gemmatimonadales bacterium]|nr:BamA/TamA family outer membrane protein [Gemmatimonadales bacterium]